MYVYIYIYIYIYIFIYLFKKQRSLPLKCCESARILYLQRTNVKVYEVCNKPCNMLNLSKWSFSLQFFLNLRVKNSVSRAQWPCSLRGVSAAARLLGLRVRFSPGV